MFESDLGLFKKRAQEKASGSEIQNPDFGVKKLDWHRSKLIKDVRTVFGCYLDFQTHSFYAK